MTAVPPHQAFPSSFNHNLPDILGEGGGQLGQIDSRLPADESRLNLWMLPEKGSAFSNHEVSSDGAGKPGNQDTGLGFDDSSWTQSGNNSGWPDSNKISPGIFG